MERLTAQGASVSIGSSAPQWAPRWIDTHFFERPAAVTQGSHALALGFSDIARPLSRIEMFFIFDEMKGCESRGTLSDDSLPDIAELDGCIILELSRSRVTNRTLRHLRRLSRLRMLDLSETAIDDNGLTYIAELHSLQFFDLGMTSITDAGIEKLSSLKNLSDLGIRGTHVTDEGVEKLKLVLPECKISRQWPRRYYR